MPKEKCALYKNYYLCSKMNMKKIIPIIGHLAFWGICGYFFLNNAYFRPFAYYHPYKEYITIVSIAIVSYFNYFFLFPRYYQPGYVQKYILISLFTVFLLFSFECLLLFNDISLFSSSLQDELMYYYYIETAILLFCRDCCFVIFFFALKNYHYLSESLDQERKTFIENTKTYNIILSTKEAKSVRINDIVYISHVKNYTQFHLSNQCSYSQYISLRKVEDLLPRNLAVKISKNHIIILSHVHAYTADDVTLFYDDKTTLTLPLSQVFRENAYRKIQFWLSYQEKIKATNDTKKAENNKFLAENGGEKSEKKDADYAVLEENKLLGEIFRYIEAHNFCKTTDIQQALNLSERSCQRYLKMLRDNNLISFSGSRGSRSGYSINP